MVVELVLLNLDQVLHLALVLGIQGEPLGACSVIAGPAEQFMIPSACELVLSMVPYDCCSLWASIVLSVQ